uniref:Uncharacterized protein n=1 Tax=Arundo donax TaxID=35708 RepID=A0A0A9HRB9_ARUDO
MLATTSLASAPPRRAGVTWSTTPPATTPSLSSLSMIQLKFLWLPLLSCLVPPGI